MTAITIYIIMFALVLVQVDKMVQRKQITFQESVQLADATSFPLGYDEGFVFAYKIFNREVGSNVSFNHDGYLNVKVQQVTIKYKENNETPEVFEK